MKKIFYYSIIIVLQFFATDVNGQSSVVAHVDMPFDISKTIIREYLYPTTISYLEGYKGDGCFIYADNTLIA